MAKLTGRSDSAVDEWARNRCSEGQSRHEIHEVRRG